MSEQKLSRMRLYLTVLATLAELANLAWEHFNGGVVSHHILDRADLPAISNWWSGLLIPVLTWFLVGCIQRRIALHSGEHTTISRLPLTVIAGFVGALLFGILISISFTHGYVTATNYLFLIMVLLALVFRGYRAECVLGFVFGMTFTFGAVLPTAVASIIAIASAVIHFGLRPAMMHLWTWFKQQRSPTSRHVDLCWRRESRHNNSSKRRALAGRRRNSERLRERQF